MAGFSLQFQALEDGESAARRLAKDYGELASGYPAKGADSSIFGRLDGSAALAALLDRVEETVGDELEFAKRRLTDVERTLDRVWQVIRNTNRANGADRAEV